MTNKKGDDNSNDNDKGTGTGTGTGTAKIQGSFPLRQARGQDDYVD